MAGFIHPRLKQLDPIMDGLLHAARESGLAMAKFFGEHPRKAGTALRPGPTTPLWNELRRRAAKHLKKRGEKVVLARFLGISRQRLHLMIKANTACPDAERALLLLAWVIARDHGKDMR